MAQLGSALDWGQGVAGSNPVTPTERKSRLMAAFELTRKLDWFNSRRLGLQGSDSDIASGSGSESLLDAFGVVPPDVFVDRLVELCDRVEDFTVVHLGFRVRRSSP